MCTSSQSDYSWSGRTALALAPSFSFSAYLSTQARGRNFIGQPASALPRDVGGVVDGDVDLVAESVEGLAENLGGDASPHPLSLSSWTWWCVG